MTTTRRAPKRRRDDTWVVKEDEFHPNPKVAALEADKNARVSALRNITEELARIDKKIATAEYGAKAPLREQRRHYVEELNRVKREQREAETEEATQA